MKPELSGPPAGVDYTRALAGAEHPVMPIITGLAGMLAGFVLLYPGVAGLLAALGWLARGKQGTYDAYWVRAMGFEYPEGLAATSLGLAAIIPLVLLMVRFVHQRRPVWLSSVQPGLRWRYMLIVFVVAAIVMNAQYWVTTGRTEFHWNPSPQLAFWLVAILLTTPLQAAGEEYLFRGYLMQVIGAAVRQKWVTVLVSGAAFMAVHGTQSVSLMVDRFAFGTIMGALVVLTGGLEAAIAAHAANNVFAFGYAALSGGVAAARSMTDASWPMVAANIGAYVVVALAAWGIARAMKAATKTPA